MNNEHRDLLRRLVLAGHCSICTLGIELLNSLFTQHLLIDTLDKRRSVHPLLCSVPVKVTKFIKWGYRLNTRSALQVAKIVTLHNPMRWLGRCLIHSFVIPCSHITTNQLFLPTYHQESSPCLAPSTQSQICCQACDVEILVIFPFVF